jgi:hypothetical protein
MSFPQPARTALATSVIALAAVVCAAQTAPPSEYQVKAAFLYNFAKFVDWPPEIFAAADTPFVFCVVGDDPTRSDLEMVLKGKTIGGRPVTVRRARGSRDWTGCHVLFVALSADQGLRWSDGAPPDGLLTVGERPAFAEHGGVIRFVMESGKVHFEINPEAANRARLKISSKLLKLARIIK